MDGGGCSMSSRPAGFSGLKAATGNGLSARSVKVELAGLAKSAWKLKSRNESPRSPRTRWR